MPYSNPSKLKTAQIKPNNCFKLRLSFVHKQVLNKEYVSIIAFNRTQNMNC